MFKPAEQFQDFKKKRDDQTEKLRRSTRDQIFSKRRNILPHESAAQSEPMRRDRHLIVQPRFRRQIENFLACHYTLEHFPQLICALNDPDIVKQHQGIIGVRKILSVLNNPPIQIVIDAGLVPRMIEYVRQTAYPQLQLEATWALTNVASGSSVQCQSIIDKGGIPLFVELLKSDKAGILEQAIWAIGNIASDKSLYRDMIIREGGVNNIVAIVEGSKDETLVKHGCWALSNLCRGDPLPKYALVKAAIAVLCRVLATKLADKEIVADCCWAISYHSDASKNKVQLVVQSKVLPRIISHLQEQYMPLLVPSIRILGNVSTGTVQHTNQLLANDILTPLEKILDHPKKVVRREACWVISNIAAGSSIQCQAIIARQTLLKKVLELFETDSNDIRRQICFIFSNLAHSGEPNLVFHLYKQTNIVRYYVSLLSCEDKMLEVVLECLYMVLLHGEKLKGSGMNGLVVDLRFLGAVELLENLQYHKSDVVYEHVSKILQNFFEIQDPLGF